MTLAELVERLRSEFLDDTAGAATGDSIWSDAEIVSALNWAQDQLCRRTHLLRDATSSLCSIAVAKAEGVYPRSFALSDKILRIERLRYSGVSSPLPQKGLAELDVQDTGWEEKEGTPSAFTLEQETDKITFNRQPQADATVSLIVTRLPLNRLSVSEMNASAEVKNRDDELCHGAAAKLYGKDDHRAFDPVRSAKWKKQFDDDLAQIIRDKAAKTPNVPVSRGDVW